MSNSISLTRIRSNVHHPERPSFCRQSLNMQDSSVRFFAACKACPGVHTAWCYAVGRKGYIVRRSYRQQEYGPFKTETRKEKIKQPTSYLESRLSTFLNHNVINSINACRFLCEWDEPGHPATAPVKIHDSQCVVGAYVNVNEWFF